MSNDDAIPGPNPFLIDDPDSPKTPDKELLRPPSPRETLYAPSSTERRGSTTALPQQNPVTEQPRIAIPDITSASLFLPIPTTDPLSTLLAKYVANPLDRPPRDVSGDWQNTDFHTLVMTNSWRALSRMARDKIVTANPSDLNLILGLWYLRLCCLARMRLYNQASAECAKLFALLNGVQPPEAKHHLFEHVLPFELEVFKTRLRYWAGDPFAYLDELHFVFAKCQHKARQATDSAIIETWIERAARIRLIIVSQLLEMKQAKAALSFLAPLCINGSPEIISAVAHICFQAGHLNLATKYLERVESHPDASYSVKAINKSIQALAEGNWDDAINILKDLVQKEPENVTAANNLGIALLNQGQLIKGIEALERVLATSPSTILSSEPFLFNLSTLYELRSATALNKKIALLVETAKWSGDGLRSSALKLA